MNNTGNLEFLSKKQTGGQIPKNPKTPPKNQPKTPPINQPKVFQVGNGPGAFIVEFDDWDTPAPPKTPPKNQPKTPPINTQKTGVIVGPAGDIIGGGIVPAGNASITSSMLEGSITNSEIIGSINDGSVVNVNNRDSMSSLSSSGSDWRRRKMRFL